MVQNAFRRLRWIFNFACLGSPAFLVRVLLGTALLQAAPSAAGDAPLANGVFLVAKPEMADPNFRETVVLITLPQVGAGPVGVIINRPLEASLSEALPDLGEVPEEFEDLFAGGPVERERILYLIRTSERPEHSLQVLSDVYLSGDPDLLVSIIRGDTPVDDLRSYAGYAGWAPDQLQVEIALGGWYVVKADADTIFADDPSTIWPDLIKRISAVVAQAPSVSSRNGEIELKSAHARL